MSWGASVNFTVTAPINRAPTVIVSNLTPAHGDTSLSATELWASITDADGDAITQYRFYDGTAQAMAGCR